MALFQNPDETTGPALFDPVDGATAVQPAEQMSDDQKRMTSVLGALATKRNTENDQKLSDTVAGIRNTIDNGGEPVVRRSIALAKQEQELAMIRDMQLKQIVQPQPGLTLKGLVDHEISTMSAAPDDNALEKEGVAAAQEGAADASAHQAAILADRIKNRPDLFNQIHDEGTKSAWLARQLDTVQGDIEKQGWFSKAWNFLETMVDPISNVRSQEGAFGDGKLFATPGSNMQAQSQAFWRADTNKIDQWGPEFIQKLKDRSALIGQNPMLVEQAIQQAYGVSDSDAMKFNFGTGMDVLGYVPFGLMARVARNPTKLMTMLGNRSGASSVTAATIARDMHTLDGAEDLSHLQSGSEAIEESMPSSVIPKTADLVRPYVGSVSDIANKIDAMEAAARSVDNAAIARLSPDQLQEAVTKNLEKMMTQYSDQNIVDLKPGPEDWRTTTFETKRGGLAHTIDQEHADQMQSLATEAMQRFSKVFDQGANVVKATEPNRYSIMLRGKQVGDLEGHVNDNTFYVGWVGPRGSLGRNWADAENIINQLGPTQMRSLIRSIQEVHPTVTRIEGFRVSGARRAAGKPAKAGINVPPVPEKRVVTSRLGVSDVEPEVLNLLDYPERQTGETVSEDASTGIVSTSVYLGRKGGDGGYATDKAARASAVRRGFKMDTYEIHHDEPTGQHFIKITENVPETGIIAPELNETDFPMVGTKSQFIKNPSNSMPDDWNRSRLVAVQQQSEIHKQVIQPLVDTMNKLSSKQRRLQGKIIARGEEDEKWYNLEELAAQYKLNGRDLTDKEAEAYYAYKSLSDWTHQVRNREMYIERARRGMVTARIKSTNLKFDTGRVNATIHANPNFDELRVFDLDNGGHYKAGTNTADLKARHDSGNYHVIELESPHKGLNGEPVKYVMASKRDVGVGPLSKNQLGYRAGGSRENAYKYFVKQSVKGKFEDGTSYFLTPKTHITARTEAEASNWAQQMNHALQAWNDNALTAAEKRAIIEESPVESYERFAQLVEDGEIRTDSEFETLFDRGLPKDMDNLGKDVLNWADPNASGASTYYMSKGRMYYSAKGDRLLDPYGEKARILDPYKTISRSLRNALSTRAIGDYNRKVIDEWARVARPYITPDSVGGDASSYNVFFNGELNPQLRIKNPVFYAKLQGNRLIHKRWLGFQFPEQSARELATRRFAEWIDTPKENSVRNTIAARVLDTTSRNPLEAVRGLVFDTFMGVFDPGQIILQTQTAVAAITVHPGHGARAAAMIPMVTLLMMNRTPSVLDHVAKATALVHGLETAEFKAMVGGMRNSGWMNVSGDVIQLDHFATSIGGSIAMRGQRFLRDKGRIPFRIAERMNRMTTYQIAWKVTKDKFPNLGYTSAEFSDRVLQEADDLNMNMTAASRAGWQQGVLSVPFQFMGYQAHMLENVLPKTFGGNPRLAASQKARLALGQMFLYGSAGVYGGDFIYDYVQDAYKDATGKDIDKDTYRTLTKGFFDTVLHYASGGELDTDFASRAGQGAAAADLIKKMSNGDFVSVIGFAGGASASVGGRWMDTVTKMSRYFKAEQNDYLTSEQFGLMANDIASAISSTNRATKAYWIWKTGLLKDPKTDEVIAKAEQVEAVAALLGIPLREETERWDEVTALAQQKDMAVDVAKQVVMIRNKAVDAWISGDPLPLRTTTTR
jgi:hypothetical protein